MAGGKFSGAIEYAARVLLTLRSVPGGAGVLEVRATKNKLGSTTGDHMRGTFLRPYPATQHVAPADDYVPPAGEDDEELSREAVREDAATVALWLAEHPGRGRRDMYRGLAPQGLGRTRADGGLGCLENAGAIVERKGSGRTLLTYLVGNLVPDDVLAHLQAAKCVTVTAATAPRDEPPDDPSEDPGDGCVDGRADTPNTPDREAEPGVCVAHPIGVRQHTHTAGATHMCAADHADAAAERPVSTPDDGQPELPKGRRTPRQRKGKRP